MYQETNVFGFSLRTVHIKSGVKRKSVRTNFSLCVFFAKHFAAFARNFQANAAKQIYSLVLTHEL